MEEQAKNRYKGISSYQPTDANDFWGREEQVKELENIILNNNLVVLSGDTGCGKTSLINAGLTPIFKENCYKIVKVRPNSVGINLRKKDNDNKDKRDNYVQEFYDSVSKEIEKEIQNTNKLLIVGKPNNERIEFKEWEKKSIWEKLFLYDYVDKYGISYNFLIIIDQFEELFQLNLNIKRIVSLLRSIDILCDYYVPGYTKIEDDSDCELTSNSNYKVFPKEKVYEKYAGRFKNNHKFLIAIRKDFLFEYMEFAKYFPYISTNIYRITHLYDDQAVEIIKKGFKDKFKGEGNISIADFIKTIIEEVIEKDDFDENDKQKDYYIDTMMLSIILTQLYEDYKEENNLQNITGEELAKKCDQSLNDYYNSKFNQFERNIRELFNNEHKSKTNLDFSSCVLKFEDYLLSDDKNFRNEVTLGDVAKIFGLNPDNKLENVLTGEKIENEEKTNKTPDDDNKQNKNNDTKTLFEVYTNKDGETRIKLRHDKLCECAKQHLLKVKNQIRYTANVYFNPMGRLDHDNCFVECFFGPWNTYRSIMRTIYFLGGGIFEPEKLNIDYLETLKNQNIAFNSKAITVEFSFRDENDDKSKIDQLVYAFDGFTHIKCKIVDSKIYEISFWKMERKYYNKIEKKVIEEEKYKELSNKTNYTRAELKTETNIPAGYYMVKFYYDYYNRLILKNFYSNNNGKIELSSINGYTSIHYKYNDDYTKLPDETYYLKLTDVKVYLNDTYEDKNRPNVISINEDKLKKAQEIKEKNPNYEIRYYKILDYEKYRTNHEDHNYGYKSEYDGNGKEIRRIILHDVSENSYKFDVIEFKRKKDSNLIEEISYFKKGSNDKFDKVCVEGNVHIVKFKYDNKNRVIQTTYLDIDKNPAKREDGVYGEEYFQYEYEYESENKNENNQDKNIQKDILTVYIDNNGKPLSNNNGVQYVVMKQIKDAEIIFWFDKDLNYKNKTNEIDIKTKEEKEGIEKKEIEYSIIYLNKECTCYFDDNKEYKFAINNNGNEIKDSDSGEVKKANNVINIYNSPENVLNETFRKAIIDCDTDAQFKLACDYRDKNDIDAAEYWFEKAANTQYELGINYRAKDEKDKAKEWFEKAANTQYELGIIYRDKGEKDKAQVCFEKASAQGHEKAKTELMKYEE